MARGYLGKISAVISANTGDYVRKLNESAKETRAFASTVQKSLARASGDASKSLEGIFTPLQKVERALRAAASQKLAFRGFDGAIRDVQSLQAAIAKLTDQKTIDLVVKTSGVGSLEELKRTISVLRNQDVTVGVEGLRQQRAALGNTNNFVVKTEVREEGKRLDDVIEALERIDAESIKKISLQVESQQLDAAALRLRQLVSAGKEIGEPLARAAKQYDGLSLSIQAAFGPALKRAQQNTEALTVAIDSGATIGQKKFAALRQQVELTEAAIKRLAAADSLVNKLGDGRSLRDVAPRQFDALNNAASVSQRSAVLSGEAASGFGLGRQEAAVRRQAEILSQNLAARERLQRQGGDTSSIDASIERQTDRLLKQLGVWERLVAAAEKYKKSATSSQDSDTARLINRERAAFEAEQNRTPPPTIDQENEIARLINRERAARDAERMRLDEQAVPLTGNRDPRTRTLNTLDQGIGDLRNRVRGVGDALSGELGPIVDGLTTRFQNLARQGVGFTAEQARRLRQEIAGVSSALDSRQSIAQRFGESFGGAGRLGLSLGVDERSLRAIGGQIEFVQGRLAGLAQEARGPVIAALDSLRTRAQQLFEGGALDTVEGRRELQLLREELIRTLSAAGGGSERRIAEQLRRVGDVARGSFGNAGLAVQQAAFAVEDFFSVTGGLDQRIRAAGNNISQLGFILGGTTGLIVGISAAIGAQLVAAMIKWYNEGRTAEDQTKSLTQALERQKSVAEQLAQSYEKVADAIRDAGLSERGRREAGIRLQVEEIQRQQRQAREGRILGADEGVATARARVATAERELAGATTAGQQVRAQLRLNAAQERQRAEERRALEAAGRPVGNFRQAAIDAISESIRRSSAQTVRTAAVVPGLPFAATFGAAQVSAEEATRGRLAALQNIGQSPRDAVAALDEYIRELLDRGESGDVILPLQQLREQILVYTRQLESDNIAARISRGALQIVSAMESAQDDIAAAFDGIRGASAIEDEIAAFGESLAQLQKAASDAAQRGDLEQVQAFNEDIEYIRRHIKALQDAASAVRTFGTALQRFSESIARDLASLEQRADAARRADIAQGTPRSGGARERADSDVREARRAQRQFEDERAAAVERFEERAIRNGDRRLARIREIDAMLAAPMGGVGADGTRGGTAAEREAARAERRRLQEDIDREVENDPAVRRARASADDATRRAEEAAMADRGRELLLRPGQRARLELDQQLRELDAALQSRINEAIKAGRPQDIATIRNEDAEARKRLQEEAFRQQAPAIFGLADSVTNALLQGPSRAALQPTDVSTVEGSRELTRLLRGDDAAKEQANLVELQKEANRLLDLIANNPANIAN